MNDLVRRTLVLALLALAMPLLAASPEYLVGGTVPTAAPDLRQAASVASDGTDFFAVWDDWRSGSVDVVGTRVRRTGQILDPLGIRIASLGFVRHPNVIWDGGAYLVTWEGEEPGESGSGRHLYAARVDRDGQVVMAPRAIADTAATWGSRYAASNGTVSVIAYLGASGATRVAVLDRQGNVLRHEVLLAEYVYRTGFAVASSGSRFLVTWCLNPSLSGLDDQTIEAIALASDGRVLGSPVRIGPGDDADVAGDGSRFTIVTRDFNRTTRRTSLTSRTVNADLTQLGPTNSIAEGNAIGEPSVLWRGDRYEVMAGTHLTETGPFAITLFELDRDGRKIATRTRDELQFAVGRSPLVAATNGADVFVAVSEHSASGRSQRIVARVYSDASSSAAPLLLSWSGNSHESPDVATSASGQIVTWTEDDGMYATRVDRGGNSLDGRGIRLASKWGRPRAAFDGTSYVVAWSDATNVRVRWIAPATGATVATAQIATEEWIGVDLALAVSADATFVVYQAGGSRIHVARIPHATHTPDPAPLAVSPAQMFAAQPAAAWNGSHLLVAWTEEYSVPNVSPPLALSLRIYGARVSGGLSLLDPAPIVLANARPDGYADYSAPSVASNGEDWLVVADLEGSDVLARRVLRNGALDANAPTKIAVGRTPVVAWDGVRYVVAWRGGDIRARELPIVVAGVPATGALVATRRSIVATQTVGTPSIAPATLGEVALAYTKLSFRPEHTGVPRSYLRLVDLASQRNRTVRP